MLSKAGSSLMSQPDLSNKTHAVSVLRRIDSAYVLSAASIMLVVVIAVWSFINCSRYREWR